jgi:hypothetical protein
VTRFVVRRLALAALVVAVRVAGSKFDCWSKRSVGAVKMS